MLDKNEILKVCYYYQKYDINKLSSKLFELEIQSGYKYSEIKKWMEILREVLEGYGETDDETIKKIVVENKNKSQHELSKEINKLLTSYEKKNVINFKSKLINIFSIKTSMDITAKAIIDPDNNNILINKLNWYKDSIKENDFIFLILGGDKKPWKNGLRAFGKVNEVILNTNEKYYEINVEKLLLLPQEITPNDFYYYPDTRNAINIGPSLKGVPNQAINKVSLEAFYSIFKAIIDLFPEYEMKIRNYFDEDIISRIYNSPMIITQGKFEDNTIKEKVYSDFEGGDTLADSIDQTDLIIDDLSPTDKVLKKNLLEKSITSLKKDVSIINETLSVYDLFRKFKRYIDFEESDTNNSLINLEDSLVLSPDFQRENVWTKKANVELIESILLGIPIPSFYFSQDINGNYLVVDGKQRLTAIFDFMNNRYSLPKYYDFLFVDDTILIFDNLQSKIKRKIEDFTLTCYTVKPQTEPSIQNEIFIRVNRGGTPLNHQEIRYATNIGQVTKLLDRISGDSELDIVNKKRKRDQYLALRYFTFLQLYNDKNLNGAYNFEDNFDSMNNLLDIIMKYINHLPKERVEILLENYRDNISKAKILFEKSNLR
ncbi:DUF262 domain-containing protein, partial [Macrococcus epidermidis]|uniref:DUF262 domain-containing protein n=1 Tax=Macrococcus epidermidis TaxID=1902580 RepID=UPI001EF3ACE6